MQTANMLSLSRARSLSLDVRGGAYVTLERPWPCAQRVEREGYVAIAEPRVVGQVVTLK